jgi:deoxyribonuclease-4
MKKRVLMEPKKGPLLGAHTSIAKGLQNALFQGRDLGCDVVQIFAKNQRSWQSAPLSAQQLELWHAAKKEGTPEAAMIHTSYLLNMAARDRRTLWRSRYGLLDELDRAALLQVPFLVLHPGAHMGAGEALGLARITRALDWVLERRQQNPVAICLENTAGQGTSLGFRFEHLAAIISHCRFGDRLGICLDTCHAFAAGYDMHLKTSEVLDELDRVCSLSRLRCLHLNDSQAALDARVDRHAVIGDGQIGKPAFAALLGDTRLRGLPMVLETPTKTIGYDEQLEKLRALV